MAIFAHLDLEPVVQINDKTRLNASNSFVTPDVSSGITAIKIKPQNNADYINVTETGYLDWQYSFAGSQTVRVLVEAGAASASADYSQSIQVVTPITDKLFSTDQDIKLHEPDILKWTEDGRKSFLNIHRRAKKLILEYLRREGYVDVYGNPFTDSAIVDIEEVRQWATFTTLRIIFEGISNSTEDVFNEKAKRYFELEQKWRSIALLRLDIDGDGQSEEDEGIDLRSCLVVRR